MSIKKVKQVKESKWFKLWDLTVYGVLAVLILALFAAFVFTKDKSPLISVKISYDNVTVFTYDFDSDSYAVLDGDHIEIVANTASSLKLKFYGEDKGHFNSITIDKGDCTVNVTDANCSASRDCVYSPEIKDKSSLPIICVIHKMVIESDFVSGTQIN